MTLASETTPALGRSVATVLRRRVLAPTTAALALLAAVFAVLDPLGIHVPTAVQLVPFAAGLLLFGLPHGALDHLVPARVDPSLPMLRSALAVVVLYLLLGGATLAVWLVAPVAGFVVFVLATWYHWGQGDVWIARAVQRLPGDRVDDALTLLVRGGVPMLVPLVAQSAVYAQVLAETTAVTGGTGPAAPSGALRLAAAGLLAALVIAQLLRRAVLRPPVAAGLGETAVLVAFFALVPAVLAIGVYFPLWHSVRHVVRLELTDPVARARLAAGEVVRPFTRFLRAAWPTTVAALALLVVLALATRQAGLGVLLVLIAVLTTPHGAVVTWMDVRWRRAGAGARSTRTGRTRAPVLRRNSS